MTPFRYMSLGMHFISFFIFQRKLNCMDKNAPLAAHKGLQVTNPMSVFRL